MDLVDLSLMYTEPDRLMFDGHTSHAVILTFWVNMAQSCRFILCVRACVLCACLYAFVCACTWWLAPSTNLAIENGTLSVHVRLLCLAQDQLNTVQVGHLQHVAQLGPAGKMTLIFKVTNLDASVACGVVWTYTQNDTYPCGDQFNYICSLWRGLDLHTK